MAPRRQPPALSSLASSSLQGSLLRLLQGEHFIDEQNNPRPLPQMDALQQVQDYLFPHLLPRLQSRLVLSLVSSLGFRRPHHVLHLLFSPRLRVVELELTDTRSAGARERQEEGRLLRVSQEDLAASLAVLDSSLSAGGPGQFRSLEQVLLVDRSEDPDFQGNPINNMANTNLTGAGRAGAWADIVNLSLCLSSHLSLCPSLTHLVLPFTSDSLLAQLSHSSSLRVFRNIYRSTVTSAGLTALAAGPVRLSLSQLLLSLNTHAEVGEGAVTALLQAAPQLRVLELGGATRSKSLYFQGGDASRRSTVQRALGAAGQGRLARLLFLQGEAAIPLSSVARLAPQLVDLTLFGWEHILVEREGWLAVVRDLEKLELVGLGLNSSPSSSSSSSSSPASPSPVFDCSLLATAARLRELRLAGWGDTCLDLGSLLSTLPQLSLLYLEDTKLSLPPSHKLPPHGLADLTVVHCATRHLGLVQQLPALFPALQSLAISSLYLDDPSRGLPFQFHLPSPAEDAAPRLPTADLGLLATMEHLHTLHLNMAYPSRLLHHEFGLPALLIRQFPALRLLSLDNYLARTADLAEYSFQRDRVNRRLQWILAHNNIDVTVHVS